MYHFIYILFNGNYCISLISTLFDIEREIPINYGLFINATERNALREQFKYLKKNDIIIMDRGYYCKDLLFELNKLEVKVIFRLKNNLKILSDLKNKKDTTIIIKNNNESLKFRIIKYFLNDKLYYLGTTIYNNNCEYFKKLYWKR
jgi:hypothetical protein